MKHLFTRPWMLAVLALVVALVPTWLAWKNYRDEALRKDGQLFEATSGLVGERFQLITVRHLNFFQIVRNQLRARPSSSFESLRLPAQLSKTFPHLAAFGQVSQEEGKFPVRWIHAGEGFPIVVGSDLGKEVWMAETIRRASQNPSPAAAVSGNRMLVVAALGNPQQGAGFIVGWIDIASLCGDASVPLLRDGVLAARPLNPGEKPPGDGKVVTIHEGGAQFSIQVERGPNFAANYGQVAPKWVLVAGIGYAAMFSLLVFLATRAFQLRSALDAERMRGQLVKSFSHEFRTPLSVILSSADLLEAGEGRMDPGRRCEVISQIQGSTRQLADMAEEILLLSRLEAPQTRQNPVSVDLRSFCEAVVRDVHSAVKSGVAIEVSAEGSAVLDPLLLRAALTNLVGNSVKYSGPEGKVRLLVKHGSGELVIAVSDSGIGIPPADIKRMGEPFHRAANVGGIPGTGLGLAIVRRSVKLMGGRLNLESEENRGTIATLTIPVA